MKSILSKVMKHRGNFISEAIEASGIAAKPVRVSVSYWQGQSIYETCGIGKTVAAAVRECDAQFFRVYPPPATLKSALAFLAENFR